MTDIASLAALLSTKCITSNLISDLHMNWSFGVEQWKVLFKCTTDVFPGFLYPEMRNQL